MYLYSRDNADDPDFPRDPKPVPSRPSPPPTPLTPGILWLLVSIVAVCGIFLLWRRAGTMVAIGQPLKNLIRPREGQIRLEDGPPEEEFTHDDPDERGEGEDEDQATLRGREPEEEREVGAGEERRESA